MLEIDTNRWRLVVELSRPAGRVLLEELRAVAGDAHLHTAADVDSVTFYADEEESLRRLALAVRARAVGEAVELARWDPGTQEWLHVGGPGPTRSRSRPAWQRVDWRVGAWLLAFVAIAFLFFWFVPGTPHSPAGPRTHDVGRAIEGVLAVIVGIGFVAYVVRRRGF